jgi:hypothetical protein
MAAKKVMTKVLGMVLMSASLWVLGLAQKTAMVRGPMKVAELVSYLV